MNQEIREYLEILKKKIHTRDIHETIAGIAHASLTQVSEVDLVEITTEFDSLFPDQSQDTLRAKLARETIMAFSNYHKELRRIQETTAKELFGELGKEPNK